MKNSTDIVQTITDINKFLIEGDKLQELVKRYSQDKHQIDL